MREIEIGFTERRLFPKSSEYPKFLESWKRMLAWVGLIDQKDWSDFKSFIEVKYNKVSDRSQRILNRLLEAIPEENRIISGTLLHKQCFPQHAEASFDEKLKQFSKELDQVILVVQNYLRHLELRQDTKMQQKLLLNSLKHKNNYELFQEETLKYGKILEDEPLTLMQAKDKWELKQQHYYHPSTQHTDYQASTFIEAIYTYETFHQLICLGYYLEALSRNIKLKNQDLDLLKSKAEPILEHAEKLPKLVQLYALVIRMTQSNSLDEYEKFKELYDSHHQQLAESDHFVIVKAVTNLLYRIFSVEGKVEIAELFFDWLKKAWDYRLYEHNGSIGDGDYLNFMLVAFFLNKYEQFKAFQKIYDPFLDPGIAETVKAFCNARLHFEKAEYNQALKLINDHFPLGSAINPKYDIRVKALRAMIYCEMLFKDQVLDPSNYPIKNGNPQKVDIDDLFHNSLNALRQYCSRLKNHGLDESLLIGNQRFANITGFLGEYALAETHPDVQTKRQQLRKEIEELMQKKGPLAYRTWLKKMVAKLAAQGKSGFPYAASGS